MVLSLCLCTSYPRLEIPGKQGPNLDFFVFFKAIVTCFDGYETSSDYSDTFRRAFECKWVWTFGSKVQILVTSEFTVGLPPNSYTRYPDLEILLCHIWGKVCASFFFFFFNKPLQKWFWCLLEVRNYCYHPKRTQWDKDSPKLPFFPKVQ